MSPTTSTDHRRVERHRAGRRRPVGRGGSHHRSAWREPRPDDLPGEFYEVDLADRAATAEVLDKIVASGKIDAVVNNVGFARFARIGSIELDDLFDTYDLNVRTAVQVVQAVLPGMLAAGWGRIVNVTSLTTLGTPERTPYAAAKAALEACHPDLGQRTGPDRHHGQRRGARAHRNRDVPRAQPDRLRPRNPLPGNHSAAPGRNTAGDRSRDLSRCSMRTPATSPARSCGPTAAGASPHDESHRPTGRSRGGAFPAVGRRDRHLRGRRSSRDEARPRSSRGYLATTGRRGPSCSLSAAKC